MRMIPFFLFTWIEIYYFVRNCIPSSSTADRHYSGWLNQPLIPLSLDQGRHDDSYNTPIRGRTLSLAVSELLKPPLLNIPPKKRKIRYCITWKNVKALSCQRNKLPPAKSWWRKTNKKKAVPAWLCVPTGPVWGWNMGSLHSMSNTSPSQRCQGPQIHHPV